MSLKDDVYDTAIITLVLYCIIGAVLTYPCLVVAYYFDKFYGIDAGFYSWLISIGVLFLLKLLRAYWLIVIIYLITLVPFIFIAKEFFEENY